MNPPPAPDADFTPASREELMSALFANLVIQQSNLALMFLGQVPHPDSGEPILDPDSARMIIDQLEMLEVKTRGNLDKRESALLQQSLTTLRMAFVEAVERGATPAPAQAPAEKPAPVTAASATSTASKETPPVAAPTPGPAADDESRKKFTKKY